MSQPMKPRVLPQSSLRPIGEPLDEVTRSALASNFRFGFALGALFGAFIVSLIAGLA